MNYQDYIKTELLVLIPVLYLIGIGLKKSKMPDKWIPTTLGAIAVVLSAIWVIATGNISGLEEGSLRYLRLLRRACLQQAPVYMSISFMYRQIRRSKHVGYY